MCKHHHRWVALKLHTCGTRSTTSRMVELEDHTHIHTHTHTHTFLALRPRGVQCSSTGGGVHPRCKDNQIINFTSHKADCCSKR